MQLLEMPDLGRRVNLELIEKLDGGYRFAAVAAGARGHEYEVQRFTSSLHTSPLVERRTEEQRIQLTMAVHLSWSTQRSSRLLLGADAGSAERPCRSRSSWACAGCRRLCRCWGPASVEGIRGYRSKNPRVYSCVHGVEPATIAMPGTYSRSKAISFGSLLVI